MWMGGPAAGGGKGNALPTPTTNGLRVEAQSLRGEARGRGVTFPPATPVGGGVGGGGPAAGGGRGTPLPTPTTNGLRVEAQSLRVEAQSLRVDFRATGPSRRSPGCAPRSRDRRAGG